MLYAYWASSASYRARILLELKGLPYEIVPVDLRAANGGEQHGPAHVARNPQRLVPVLEHGAVRITQTQAIGAYLDETFPERPLLPTDAVGRARVRSIASYIACEIQPLQNLRVQQHLAGLGWRWKTGISEWTAHWIATGFDAVEQMLAAQPAAYVHGHAPGLADAFLVPQVLNARRAGLELERWPHIARVDAALRALDSVRRAAPEAQPDAPPPAMR